MAASVVSYETTYVNKKQGKNYSSRIIPIVHILRDQRQFFLIVFLLYGLHLSLSVYQICCSVLPGKQKENIY